jgi:hypothetical protein
MGTSKKNQCLSIKNMLCTSSIDYHVVPMLVGTRATVHRGPALRRRSKCIYYRYDLVTILEDVNRDLSVKKSKYRAGDVTAVSTFVSCLRGQIFFQ